MNQKKAKEIRRTMKNMGVDPKIYRNAYQRLKRQKGEFDFKKQ